MGAIEKLIEAANAEAQRIQHRASTTSIPELKRTWERDAMRWALLAAEAALELATIYPPNVD